MDKQREVARVERALKSLTAKTLDARTFRWGVRCDRLLREVQRLRVELDDKLTRLAAHPREGGEDTVIIR